jgi:hypothetical protein
MRALKSSSIYSFWQHNVTYCGQPAEDSLEGLMVKAYLGDLKFNIASHNGIKSKLGNLG